MTLENLYGLDPARTSARQEGDDFAVRAAGLACAGQQLKAEGKATLHLRAAGPGRLRATIRARAPEPIRCVKLLLRDLATPLRVIEETGEREAPPSGEILAYPNRLPTPLLEIRAGAERLGVRAEDPEVREKRFALSSERIGPLAGRGVLEVDPRAGRDALRSGLRGAADRDRAGRRARGPARGAPRASWKAPSASDPSPSAATSPAGPASSASW